MNTRKVLVQLAVLATTLCLGLPAAAQKHEISLIGGGYVPFGSTLDVSPGFALEGSYGHRFIGVPFAAVYGELPVAAGFRIGSKNTLGQTFSAGNYSALFITPGLKLKLAPELPFSPYFVAGIGYAHFSVNNNAAASIVGTSANKAVFDVGGGMDIKVAPFVSLRGEVRDFHTTSTNVLSIVGVTGHNVVAGGGIVLRF